MIIDSSAIVAIVREEPELDAFVDLMAGAELCRMSAATYLESAIVIDSTRNPSMIQTFEEFLRTSGLVIEPVTVEQAEIARVAYRDFGRRSGHPARLNFGDCFAYALATSAREPLLYKGDDFGHTDVRAAV